jgi:formyltetrahydrofolate deformylase
MISGHEKHRGVTIQHSNPSGTQGRGGRDLPISGRSQPVVLSRGVRWHLEHRVLVYQNKTVVFV